MKLAGIRSTSWRSAARSSHDGESIPHLVSTAESQVAGDASRPYARCVRWTFGLVMLLSLLGLALEAANGRLWMDDLEVYRTAASRLAHHTTLYQPVTVFYRYKYAPTAAAFFIPWMWLPTILAKCLYWLMLSLMACTAVLGTYAMQWRAAPSIKPRNMAAVVIVVLLAFAPHIQRELHLGQVNLALAAVYIGVLALMRRGRPWLAGVTLAATLFVKPFGLIFLPYLALKRRYKTLAATAAATAGFAAVPWLFYPPSVAVASYRSWFHELALELASHKANLLAAGNHTIFSLIARLLPTSWGNAVNSHGTVFRVVVLAVLGGFFLYLWYRGRRDSGREVAEWAVLVAAIPLLSFTDYNAFIFTIMAAVIACMEYGRLTLPGKVLLPVGLTLLALSTPGLFTRESWRLFNGHSLVAYGATIVTLTTVWILRSSLTRPQDALDQGP